MRDAQLPAVIASEASSIGIHNDVTAARYHSDDFGPTPTLSSSIAKLILMRTPAHGRLAHPRLNSSDKEPEDDDGKFDLGSAAHEMILGRGGGIDMLDYPDWRTRAAKEARAASREAGRTPMLIAHYERACKVTKGALSHPHAPYERGQSETVLVWRDIGGPLCRAMIDHWDGGTLITDCKITDQPLTDDVLSRHIVNLGYDLSAGFYLRGMSALLPSLAGRLRFRWHFIEASPPFGSRMIEASREMLAIGDRKAALAIATWDRCLASGLWPTWSRDVEAVPAPWRYVEKQMEVEMSHPDADRAVFTDTLPAPPLKRLMEPV